MSALRHSASRAVALAGPQRDHEQRSGRDDDGRARPIGGDATAGAHSPDPQRRRERRRGPAEHRDGHGQRDHDRDRRTDDQAAARDRPDRGEPRRASTSPRDAGRERDASPSAHGRRTRAGRRTASPARRSPKATSTVRPVVCWPSSSAPSTSTREQRGRQADDARDRADEDAQRPPGAGRARTGRPPPRRRAPAGSPAGTLHRW